MAERFASVSEDELCEKMYNKTIIEFGFRMISCSTSSNNCLMSAGIFNFTPKGGECVIFTPRFNSVVLIQINRDRETALEGS